MRRSPLALFVSLPLFALSGCHGNPPPQQTTGSPGSSGSTGPKRHISYVTTQPNGVPEVHHAAANTDTLTWSTDPGDSNSYQIHFYGNTCQQNGTSVTNLYLCANSSHQPVTVTCTVQNHSSDDYYDLQVWTQSCPGPSTGGAAGAEAGGTGATKKPKPPQRPTSVSHCNGCVVGAPPPCQ